MRVQIDQKRMTVKLLAEYKNEDRIPSASQGSMQDLPNGNVILGYGFSGVYTEFAHDGTLLCDTHIGPERNYGSGDVQTYRSFKFEWHGYPNTKPALAITVDKLNMWRAWMSWNGATEVKTWFLQGANESDADEEHWSVLEQARKNGFETSIYLQSGHPRWFRVKAVDHWNNVLGISEPMEAPETAVVVSIPREYTSDDLGLAANWPWQNYDIPEPVVDDEVLNSSTGGSWSWPWMAVPLAAVAGVAVGVFLPRLKKMLIRQRRRSHSGRYQKIHSDETSETSMLPVAVA